MTLLHLSVAVFLGAVAGCVVFGAFVILWTQDLERKVDELLRRVPQLGGGG